MTFSVTTPIPKSALSTNTMELLTCKAEESLGPGDDSNADENENNDDDDDDPNDRSRTKLLWKRKQVMMKLLTKW